MRTGLHANDTRDHAKILDYYRRSGAKTFKTLVYHDDLLAALKGLGVTIIGRLHEERQRLGGSDAQRFLNRVLDSARRHPHVDYWEGFNEAFHIPGEIERYAEYEIERMRALEQIGKKAAIGCFATGTPEITDNGRTWRLFRPAIEHAARGGHALALHEYAGPYMQYMTLTADGLNQWNGQQNRFVGASTDPAQYRDPKLRGYLTLRYRMVYDLFKTWGITDLPLFITEGGVDNTSPRPGGQGAGYKDFASTEWARMPAVGDYAEQRRWYMWQVSHDRYVKGVVDFGWEGTATGWASFDLAADPAMVNRIIAAEAPLPEGHHAGTTPPPPPPPTAAERLAQLLAERLGDRFHDVRATLPRHATARFGALDLTKVAAYAVHHTAGARDQAVEAIARYHVDTNGWAGIGYHLVVRQGHVYYAGAVDTARAHVFGRNHELIGISVTGDYTQAQPAADDVAAARVVVAALDAVLGRKPRIDGHGALALAGHGTACPGRWQAIAATLRDQPPEPARPDEAKLWQEAAAKQVIHLNPAAALQRAILSAGLVPTSDEWGHGDRWVAQRAESLSGGVLRVYVYDKRSGQIVRYVPGGGVETVG